MNAYIEQKENLERQGWQVRESIGGKSYFEKRGISGLVVEVDQVTGAADIRVGCPPSFAEKHKPEIIRYWGGKREGSGRPATGRRLARIYVTEEEEEKLRKYLEELRGC